MTWNFFFWVGGYLEGRSKIGFSMTHEFHQSLTLLRHRGASVLLRPIAGEAMQAAADAAASGMVSVVGEDDLS